VRRQDFEHVIAAAANVTREFAAEALRCALVDADVLLSRVGDLPVSGEAQAHITRRLDAIVATLQSGAS
jgi:hypothetical protein